MKIYLDTCSLQRPFDSKTQIRIVLEAEAVLGVIALCEAGDIDLISSDALYFETERNPKPVRKEYAMAVLSNAKLFIDLNEQIKNQAQKFLELGISITSGCIAFGIG